MLYHNKRNDSDVRSSACSLRSFLSNGEGIVQCPSSSFACVLHRRSPDVSLIPRIRRASAISERKLLELVRGAVLWTLWTWGKIGLKFSMICDNK
jgi:hypothetical protein